MKVVRYKHHDVVVAVNEELKGKHREHCLCYHCVKFAPGKEHNCPIAQATYENCVKHGITTPMYECPKFSIGRPDMD